MAAKIEDKDTILRKLFGVRAFDYVPEDNPDNQPPVRIEVMPFQPSKLGEIADAAVKLGTLYYVEQRSINEIIGMAADDIVRVLRPYVKVPADDRITIEDLPDGAFAEALTHFIRSLSPGKWQALGATLMTKFSLGDTFAAIRRDLTGAKAAQSK